MRVQMRARKGNGVTNVATTYCTRGLVIYHIKPPIVKDMNYTASRRIQFHRGVPCPQTTRPNLQWSADAISDIHTVMKSSPSPHCQLIDSDDGNDEDASVLTQCSVHTSIFFCGFHPGLVTANVKPRLSIDGNVSVRIATLKLTANRAP